MVERHWNLNRDPFDARLAPFVATPTHREALARLRHAIEAGERRAALRSGAGLGKSAVLARLLAEVKGPRVRIARASSPTDGLTLLATLAEGLGGRCEPGATRGLAWRRLADAVRLCRSQDLGVVLAIDDCQDLTTADDRLDLDRLVHLDPHPRARLTVLQVGRIDGHAPEPWDLAIRLEPLTRSEAADYLAAKLAAAGRADPAFTPRALTRWHALAGGVPRGLDRLAALALIAGAVRGLEIITPEVVDGVAAECQGPDALAIPGEGREPLCSTGRSGC